MSFLKPLSVSCSKQIVPVAYAPLDVLLSTTKAVQLLYRIKTGAAVQTEFALLLRPGQDREIEKVCHL